MIRLRRLALLAFAFALASGFAHAQTKPVKFHVLVLAEPGGGLHKAFADRAIEWLRTTGEKEGFDVTYIRTPDPITDEYLSKFQVMVQTNHPPYHWSESSKAAFRKAMENGTIGWFGMHHASLLGKFDGFEMDPWFHEFMGGITFKSYIPDFADGTVRVEDGKHPVMRGLPKSFTIKADEWYTYDVSPRPNVHVLANVDENSYQPARDVKMGDHPVIWTNPHFKARNVYFQFGHHAELFDDPNYVKLFHNALFWAAGQMK